MTTVSVRAVHLAIVAVCSTTGVAMLWVFTRAVSARDPWNVAAACLLGAVALFGAAWLSWTALRTEQVGNAGTWRIVLPLLTWAVLLLLFGPRVIALVRG